MKMEQKRNDSSREQNNLTLLPPDPHRRGSGQPGAARSMATEMRVAVEVWGASLRVSAVSAPRFYRRATERSEKMRFLQR